MKLTDIGLIFALVFISLAVVFGHRMEQVNQTQRLQLIYNQAVDNSLEAAMDRLVEVDDGLRARVNKEEAVEIFFRNLSIHFQVIENINMNIQLRRHVPAIAVVLEDGFYIYYYKEVYENGTKILKKMFTDKIYYEYQDNEYRYYFTISDYIRMVDLESNEEYEGRYKDIIEGEVGIRSETLKDEEDYHRIRRGVIIGKLQETIEHYINNYNKISNHYGINYQFKLPTIDEEDWYRTIDDISMIAFLQGYPYAGSFLGTYNYYAIAGARIHK